MPANTIHHPAFTVFRPKRMLYYLLMLTGLWAYSLWHNAADIDDAWIGEHAYWLATDGHARSELMRGITQQEDYLIVHHKLLTLHGALFIKLSGFSLYSLKAVSLLYFLLFAGLFLLYTSKDKPLPWKERALFGAILLLSFPWIFKYSFVYRPEVMVMTLAFGSWILLEKVLEKESDGWARALAAGILAGLCFSAHLNGIVVAGAGFILLLIHRKYMLSIVFGAGALLGAAVYFYDFNATYGFEFWKYQLTSSPALDSLPDIPLMVQPLVNLANEHQRFFHNPMIAFFSVFAIFSIIAGWKRLLARRRNMLLYTFLLALLLGLTAMHKSRQYLLIYFPFLVILITEVYSGFFDARKKNDPISGWRNTKTVPALLWLLLISYLGSGLYFNIQHSLNKFYAGDNRAIVKKYMSDDPAELNIVAPMTFIFNEIKNFQRIQSDICYAELQKSDTSITAAGFLEKTKAWDIHYIILSDFIRDKLGWSDPESVQLPDEFEIISEPGEEYLIFRRKTE